MPDVDKPPSSWTVALLEDKTEADALPQWTETHAEARLQISSEQGRRLLQLRLPGGGESLLSSPLQGAPQHCRLGDRTYAWGGGGGTDGSAARAFQFRRASDCSAFASALAQALRSDDGAASSQFDSTRDEGSSDQYFRYYGQLMFQQNMLQDVVRTSLYRRAVFENGVDFRGKVVVDVGCGSGILSFFAAQAGARKVYAIEASRAADDARMLVRGNGLESVITVVHGKVEDVELPEECDIIISEPMGTLLVNERMIESFVIARDRFMRKSADGSGIAPGCNMFPSRSTIYLAPFCDEALFAEQYNKTLFFAQNEFHGVDLTPLRDAALRSYFSQPIVDAFDPSLLLDEATEHLLDFRTTTDAELQRIEIPFRFTAAYTAQMHGIAGWFDVEFLGSASKVVLTTAPGAPTTHWHQLRCLFQTPVFVMAGQTISGNLLLQTHERHSYWMHVTLHEPIQVMSTLDLKEPHQRMGTYFVPGDGGEEQTYAPAPAAAQIPQRQQSPQRGKPQPWRPQGHAAGAPRPTAATPAPFGGGKQQGIWGGSQQAAVWGAPS